MGVVSEDKWVKGKLGKEAHKELKILAIRSDCTIEVLVSKLLTDAVMDKKKRRD
jgi:hypothetical protein